jgi:hypothetical protein
MIKKIKDFMEKRAASIAEQERLVEEKRKTDLEAIIQRNWEQKRALENAQLEKTFADPHMYLVNVALPLEILVDDGGKLQVNLRLTNLMTFNFNKADHFQVEKDLAIMLITQYLMDEIKRRAAQERKAA